MKILRVGAELYHADRHDEANSRVLKFSKRSFKIKQIQHEHFQMWDGFFFFLRKLRWNANVVEEYCWVITEAAGRSCCGRSGSSLLEWDSKWTSLYIHTSTVEQKLFSSNWQKIGLAPDLPECNCCTKSRDYLYAIHFVLRRCRFHSRFRNNWWQVN